MSQIDDSQAPVAQQLAQQHKEEKAYSAAPFGPYTNSTIASLDECLDQLASEKATVWKA